MMRRVSHTGPHSQPGGVVVAEVDLGNLNRSAQMVLHNRRMEEITDLTLVISLSCLHKIHIYAMHRAREITTE